MRITTPTHKIHFSAVYVINSGYLDPDEDTENPQLWIESEIDGFKQSVVSRLDTLGGFDSQTTLTVTASREEATDENRDGTARIHVSGSFGTKNTITAIAELEERLYGIGNQPWINWDDSIADIRQEES